MTQKYLKFRGALYQIADDQIDKHAVRDIRVFINNDADLHSMKMNMYRNLLTKVARGMYDSVRAVDLFMYLVKRALTSYQKPHSEMKIDLATRKAVAQELRDEFEEYARVDTEHMREMLPKKYRDVPLEF